MRALGVSLALLMGSCAGDAAPVAGVPSAHRIPAPSAADQADLSQCLIGLNTSDRRAQREVLLRIKSYGIRALPILLGGVEIGSAQTREGCKEAILDLADGSVVLEEGRVPHRRILEGWILFELGRGYASLPEALTLGARTMDPVVARSIYRQYLCQILEKVGSREAASRLFEATREDRSELVRCAAYQALARLGAKPLVPELVGHYGSETGQARHSLWIALRTLTGKNYPDEPSVWAYWLDSGGS